MKANLVIHFVLVSVVVSSTIAHGALTHAPLMSMTATASGTPAT